MSDLGKKRVKPVVFIVKINLNGMEKACPQPQHCKFLNSDNLLKRRVNILTNLIFVFDPIIMTNHSHGNCYLSILF